MRRLRFGFGGLLRRNNGVKSLFSGQLTLDQVTNCIVGIIRFEDNSKFDVEGEIDQKQLLLTLMPLAPHATEWFKFTFYPAGTSRWKGQCDAKPTQQNGMAEFLCFHPEINRFQPKPNTVPVPA